MNYLLHFRIFPGDLQTISVFPSHKITEHSRKRYLYSAESFYICIPKIDDNTPNKPHGSRKELS